MSPESNPALVGPHEIRVMLGSPSRQRAYQITHHPTFPAALVDLKQGKVWLHSEVAAWIAVHRPTQNQPMD